jgi:hypothetical protein
VARDDRGGAEYQVGFTVGQQAFYRLSGRQQVMMFNVKFESSNNIWIRLVVLGE